MLLVWIRTLRERSSVLGYPLTSLNKGFVPTHTHTHNATEYHQVFHQTLFWGFFGFHLSVPGNTWCTFQWPVGCQRLVCSTACLPQQLPTTGWEASGGWLIKEEGSTVVAKLGDSSSCCVSTKKYGTQLWPQDSKRSHVCFKSIALGYNPKSRHIELLSLARLPLITRNLPKTKRLLVDGQFISTDMTPWNPWNKKMKNVLFVSNLMMLSVMMRMIRKRDTTVHEQAI